ncbi:3-hydroxyacyl-CoA dehydrogenase family protein [Sulfuracidifex metallicus]|jgi:3-hydroxypropionate dehydrogenase (NADP+)|uniref:3-hydroxyacyl-CoA dehydrogenase family protein n=1 Tax=Sulfuracidifex metallicus DSM 6482 = JCM 9184 TaxID=523847 RepID=A0A6A9QJ79_SULME|nr:3-hydroxyacyl-CoA dehydrogenase family protein [Sulfuracidifex metallicus]MUN28189.1 3-hydroxyacyl-CoA dehydrogenase family protein [Sulfuracidifex metallicus DSM 6482 = JCM 9184]WOE51276.1 3-hydroxyacyl-CoA dehydrogenase family protein [Sulfuracidifex metallicus DSM 6482 = JCM 9184]
MRDIKKVSVIGAGVIGAGWATLIATKGYSVSLYSEKKETLDKAMAKVNGYLEVMKNVKMVSQEPESYTSKIQTTTNLDEAIEGTDYVLEAIIEEYDAKKKLFGYLDERLDKDVILASSTSGLLMTEMQKAMKRHPERGVIDHPWNPPHLLPLVEIVPGEKTSKETLDASREFMDKLDRIVVVLKKEVPGFLGNRLAFALFREAVYLVDEGVATVEDIDKVMTAAIGLRWAFMGPFLTYHLGGGEGGLEYFFNRGFGYGANEWMYDLAKYDKFPYTGVVRSVSQMKDYEFLKGKTFPEISKWRDEKLISIFKLVWGDKFNMK